MPYPHYFFPFWNLLGENEQKRRRFGVSKRITVCKTTQNHNVMLLFLHVFVNSTMPFPAITFFPLIIASSWAISPVEVDT